MNNNTPNRKRRKNTSSLFSKKKGQKSHLNCTGCGISFSNKNHLTSHLQESLSCKSIASHPCHFCSFLGVTEDGLKQHISKKDNCRNLYSQYDTTTGLLPSIEKFIKHESTEIGKDGVVTTNYNVARTSALGTVDNVLLSIHDHSLSNLKSLTDRTDTKTSQHHNLAAYLDDNRTMAGLQDNQFSSFFHMQESSVLYNPENDESYQRFNVVPPPPVEIELDFNSDDNDFIECQFNDDDSSTDSSIEIDDYQEECDRFVINCQSTVVDLTTENNPIDSIAPRVDLTDDVDPPVVHNIELAPVFDIREEQKALLKHFSKLRFHKSDEIMIDLFHILKASNAPLVLFDRIIEWVKVHEQDFIDTGTLGLQRRKRFILDLNRQLYRKKIMMKPRVERVILSSLRTTSVVTFSMREKILQMVTNLTTFHSGNLLLDPINPCGPPPDTGYYGEVNSGTWHKEAITRECTQPNHILMPFCHFIDGLKVDKYGKLTVEAVLSCCLWFNRKARNRAANWWVHGFVQDQKLFRDQQSYVRDDRAQDYHDMMSKIFEEMRQIRESGGIKLHLMIDGHEHDVVAIPVVQFIIGDCKGNDLLCGRKGGHSLQMASMCRDCDVRPDDADDPCIGKELNCSFLNKRKIEGKSKEELDQFSYLYIENAFSRLSFGGCNRGIYGATPAEILHAIQLGLCEYVAESLDVFFTNSVLDIISYTVVGIFHNSHRQSERNLPGLGPFRQGLMSVKSLKAKERFARVYCIYLALNNSYCIQELCKKRFKKRDSHGDNSPPFITRDFLRSYCGVIEDTILFHEWLKQDQFLKSDFVVENNGVDSRAMGRIKQYLAAFKHNIIRRGNGLKTPKFHQMLHLVDYIMRHGCPMNYDGSRGENFGKTKIKDNAKLTNRQRDTLNFDIGTRLSEEDVVDQVSSIYYRNMGKWPSSYCNDTDIANNYVDVEVATESSLSRYRMKVTFEDNSDNQEGTMDKISVVIDWGGPNKTPLLSYPRQLLIRLASRLFVGTPNIGGKVDPDEVVPGLTQVKRNGIIYRAHPCHSKKGSWFDWAYFEWGDVEGKIPGRILMIIDLRKVKILYEPDNDPDNGPVPEMKHLTNEIWVIVAAAVAPVAEAVDLSDDHFDSKIHKRIKLQHEDDLWLVPLSAIRGPCFVVCNKDYTSGSFDNDVNDDKTAYVIQPTSKWPQAFLPPLLENHE